MWNLAFWTFFVTALTMAGVSVALRKLRFADIQVMIMIAAVSMACDMIFCKQLELYHYVSMEYRGWYSFWANLFICPAFGLVFIKFIPKGLKRIAVYIAVWTAVFTLFELFIAKPSGILFYPRWKIIPYSPIGYVLVLTWEYIYFILVEKRVKH